MTMGSAPKPAGIATPQEAIEKPSFSEVKTGDTIKFICRVGAKQIGSISATSTYQNIYEVGALFVDPSQRGQGISSMLVKNLNDFLRRNNSVGRLVNTIHGDAARVYENNGWVKGGLKVHNAYVAHEYTYDGVS